MPKLTEAQLDNIEEEAYVRRKDEQELNLPSRYTVYCSGTCSQNPGPGGWGCVVMWPEEDGLHKTERSGHVCDQTSQRMEITAAIEALSPLNRRVQVELYSNSEYLIYSMIPQPESGKLFTRRVNRDLWEKLDSLCRDRQVVWRWVKGHSGDPNQERADRLAAAASKECLL